MRKQFGFWHNLENDLVWNDSHVCNTEQTISMVAASSSGCCMCRSGQQDEMLDSYEVAVTVGEALEVHANFCIIITAATD